jgi:hypothetical protein
MRKSVLVPIVLACLGSLSAFASDSATDEPGGPPPVVAINQIDPDALVRVQRLLACLGHYRGPLDGKASPDLDLALRKFARARELDAPTDEGKVSSRTIDELGAGPDVALRWGSTEPRAPELTAEQLMRVNQALVYRGYRTSPAVNACDADTIAAIRSFQAATGHPVQLGNCLERRWMFILGVATGEAKFPDTLPASHPR